MGMSAKLNLKFLRRYISVHPYKKYVGVVAKFINKIFIKVLKGMEKPQNVRTHVFS